MNNFIQYIKDSFEELNSVTWLSREEAQKLMVVVAVFTIIFSLIIAGVDKVFQLGLDNFFKIF